MLFKALIDKADPYLLEILPIGEYLWNKTLGHSIDQPTYIPEDISPLFLLLQLAMLKTCFAGELGESLGEVDSIVSNTFFYIYCNLLVTILICTVC